MISTINYTRYFDEDVFIQQKKDRISPPLEPSGFSAIYPPFSPTKHIHFVKTLPGSAPAMLKFGGRQFLFTGSSKRRMDVLVKLASGKEMALCIKAYQTQDAGTFYCIQNNSFPNFEEPTEPWFFVDRAEISVPHGLLQKTSVLSIEKIKGKYWLKIPGTLFLFAICENFLLSLIEGTLLAPSKALEELTESFESGAEVREGATPALNLVGVGRKALGKDAAGFLFEVLANGFYKRILPEKVQSVSPLALCNDCGFFDDKKRGKFAYKTFYCNECRKTNTHTCMKCSKESFSLSPKLLRPGKKDTICDKCISSGCYECSQCSNDSETFFHFFGEKAPCTAFSVRNYSYSPKHLARVGLKRTFPFHMGVEWELSTPRSQNLVKFVLNEFPGLFFPKSDSSIIGGGVEFVSIPASREYWDKNFNADRLAAFSGEVSAPGKGGIHIHVDRSAFKHDQIQTIMDFFWDARESVYRLAGRESGFAKILDKRLSGGLGRDLSKAIGGDKYLAINFRHEKTLEFRLFDSTLDNNEYQKNLDFLCATWAWTKDGGITPTWDDFTKYVKSEKGRFSYLHGFMERKIH